MTETIQRLKNEDWEILIDKLRRKSCTPFLGPDVCANGFEQRAEIAVKFAERWGYPLDDKTDLARVGRFVSVKFNADFARGLLSDEYERLRREHPPDFKDPDDPHVALASLPIPVYITTNHNDYMMQALRLQEKDAHQELCKWKPSVAPDSKFLAEGREPSPAQPVVFHLYGYPQVIDRSNVLESLVFTEDDFFEFLINVSGDDDAIPLRIRKAMAGTSLLLLGYRMEEWDFRVLFHYLLAKPLQISKDRMHVAVQVPIDEAKPEEQRKKVQEFLDRYIASKRLDIRVYWGTSHEFIIDLMKKWKGGGR